MEWLWWLLLVPAIAGAVWYILWVERMLDTPEPLPKINQLDELVDDYIIKNQHNIKLSRRAVKHHDERMQWMKEYTEALEDAKLNKLANNMGLKEIPRETATLQIIQALTNRHGFYHPKTQAAVKLHEEQTKRWDNIA